jgi:hypothetical protein
MKHRLLVFVLIGSTCDAWAEEFPDGGPRPSEPSAPISPSLPTLKPIAPREYSEQGGVQWGSLILQSFKFALIEHGYRYATEQGTRDPGRPFVQGYIDSVGALHGWADGDPFYVNYVGHPMQGAVSGYLWILNDHRYRGVEFGRNPEYWKSRLRAGAFAWVYSEQMEIGPFSEASLGNIQATFPQQGLVDHVVTPTIGLGWLIAEDAMDRYVIRFLEARTRNRYLRALLRGGLNPSRSFANVISGQWPWARTRGMENESLAPRLSQTPGTMQEPEPRPGVAPFELAANAYVLAVSSGPCTGGGATTGFRIRPTWQIILDVNGCKMNNLQQNLTGDSLSYLMGVRWTPQVRGRWVPYAQILAGGNKLTQELTPLHSASALSDHEQYTREFEADSFAYAAGTGMDLHLNRALAVRLVNLEYTRSWARELNGFKAPNGLQIKAGIVLHMGTW